MGRRITAAFFAALLMGLACVASAGFYEKETYRTACEPLPPDAVPCPVTETENERLKVQAEWCHKELDEVKKSLSESREETRDTQARLSEVELAFAINSGELPMDEGAPEMTRGVLPEVYSLFFSSGATVFSEDVTGEVMDAIVQAALQAESITVIGFSDDRGSRSTNKSLAMRRAEAARQFFVENGVAPEKIVVGERSGEYISTNATAEGRALNRRVDIRVR